MGNIQYQNVEVLRQAEYDSLLYKIGLNSSIKHK